MLIVALLAVLIGLSLGLLGGGGSILAVPILTYAAGMPPKEAIATSLLVVGSTALWALVPHARAGKVEWRTGGLFALASMAGAFAGGRAAGWFSGTTLLLLFAGIMVLAAGAMFRGRKDLQPRQGAMPLGQVVAVGVGVGAVTGLVGAGGGFVVVPALVLLGGMPMHRAIGTSLLVIALNSGAAFAGHAGHVRIDWGVTGVVAAAAALGTVAGSLLAHRVPADLLRRGFAWFVLAMAGYVVWREAGAAMAAHASTWGWPLALLGVLGAAWALARYARHSATTP